MAKITLLTPSVLPKRNSEKGEMYARIDKHTFTLSAALAQSMGMKIGKKVQIVQYDDVFFIIPAQSEDGFILRGSKANAPQFSSSPLTHLILGKYNALKLVEDKKFASFKFDVKKQTLPYMIAGVETYWKIEPPKKFEPLTPKGN